MSSFQRAVKKQAVAMSLDNVIGIPVREQALVSEARNQSSSVRNAYRKDVSKFLTEDSLELDQFKDHQEH